MGSVRRGERASALIEQRAGGLIVVLRGGFSEEPDNLALARYVLSLTRPTAPRVCFVSVTSGDAKGYIDRFYAAFGSLDRAPAHLSLLEPPAAALDSFLHEQDVIIAGGAGRSTCSCGGGNGA